MPLPLWAGNLTPAPSFPPPNPTRAGGSVPSRPCPVGSQAKPSTFPRGRPAPAQPLGGPEGSCLAAESEGREALQFAEKRADERQARQAVEKDPAAACAPVVLPAPARRSAHPAGRRVPSPRPSPGSPAPLCLQGRPPSHGFKEAGSWHRHCSALAGCASRAWTGSLPSPLPPAPSLALGALHPKPAWVSASF